jgi:hypothetical protein
MVLRDAPIVYVTFSDKIEQTKMFWNTRNLFGNGMDVSYSIYLFILYRCNM